MGNTNEKKKSSSGRDIKSKDGSETDREVHLNLKQPVVQENIKLKLLLLGTGNLYSLFKCSQTYPIRRFWKVHICQTSEFDV